METKKRLQYIAVMSFVVVNMNMSLKAGVHVNLSEILVSLKRG